MTISSLATLADIATIFAIFSVVFQLALYQRGQFQASRPYIHLEVLPVVRDGNMVLILRVMNSGQTPANSIQIEFESEVAWNAVSNPSKYPFVSPNSIGVIFPGSKQEFFLGPMKGQVNLAHYKSQEIHGICSYSTGRTKRVREDFSLTLSDTGFRVRRD